MIGTESSITYLFSVELDQRKKSEWSLRATAGYSGHERCSVLRNSIVFNQSYINYEPSVLMQRCFVPLPIRTLLLLLLFDDNSCCYDFVVPNFFSPPKSTTWRVPMHRTNVQPLTFFRTFYILTSRSADELTGRHCAVHVRA